MGFEIITFFTCVEEGHFLVVLLGLGSLHLAKVSALAGRLLCGHILPTVSAIKMSNIFLALDSETEKVVVRRKYKHVPANNVCVCVFTK